MSESLDLIIAGTAPDEVTVAANRLINQIQDKYDPIIAKAGSFQHEIDEDPVKMGVRHFNHKLHLLRADANTINQWHLEVIAEKRKAQSRVKAAKVAYDEKLQLMLTSDMDVREVEGQQHKMALAKKKLAKEARVVAYCEQIYTMVLGYAEAIKLAADNLGDTKRDLMAQLAVIKQSVAIGETSGGAFPIGNGDGSVPASRFQEMEASIASELPESGVTKF